MKHPFLLALGLLTLIACGSPNPPASKGTKIKASDGGVVGSQQPGDGQLEIDPGGLLADLEVTLDRPETNPEPPAGIEGGFTPLRVQIGNISTRPLPMELPNCKIRLRINLPANVSNSSELMLFKVLDAGQRNWRKLQSFETIENDTGSYLRGCLDGLKDGDLYTIGRFKSTFGFSAGTAEVVEAPSSPTNGQLVPVSNTLFRVQYTAPQVQGLPTPNPVITIDGPSNWHDGVPYQLEYTPSGKVTLLTVPLAPVSGTYKYEFDDGVKVHKGEFVLDANALLPRPARVTATPSDLANAFNISWAAPKLADPNGQQAEVFLFDQNWNPQNSTPIDQKTGLSPLTLSITDYNPQASYVFCVNAWDKAPFITPLTEQVNISQACTVLPGQIAARLLH